MEEMESTRKNELIRVQEKYKLQKKLLIIHVTVQPVHPGVQRTICKIRHYFWWKGMAGDIREFLELSDLPTREDRPHVEEGKSLVPDLTRDQMVRSKH